MGEDLPQLYFRLRETGALVFRLDMNTRNRRLEMQPIATVNAQTGAVKPQAGQTVTEDERAAIAAWVSDRQALQRRRQSDDIQATIDRLNLTAHWAQVRAEEAELDAVTDALLLAMHDLRTVLVRRRSGRVPDSADD